MIALSFSQVLLRQFWGMGILWGDTLARHLVLWVGFLGASLASAQGKHFAWEGPSCKGAGASILRWTAPLTTLIISLLLTKAAWIFFLEEKASGSILFRAGSLEIAAWVFAAAIPAGFLLISIHTALRCVLKS